ncbi:YcjF family protein [Rubrobacter aplysinae]|uniref:YcjF family protein n=1 Tax=Rubrobacter aplysinae TaxID=909625 RepID=UPI00128CCDFE|nr:DUF697 domain-containing protein [Rubrobacter aplysinae]
MSIRSLYRVFNETRRAARERATVAVTGKGGGADSLARALGAGRGTRGAEIIIAVREGSGGETVLDLSGKAIESPGELTLRSEPLLSPEAELLGEVVPWVAGRLDEDYLVSLGRGYEAFRRAVCEEVIHNNARQNAFIGALPVPGADLPVMTANQGRMVLQIASIYGEEITLDRARELLGVLGAGLGFRAVGRQVVKIVPFGGWAVSGAIGYAGTLAMGRAAVLYFERGYDELGQQEISGIRDRAAHEARDFVSRVRRENKGNKGDEENKKRRG